MSGRGTRPASPPWVLGLVHQVLYVLVDPFQPGAQCQASYVEKLFDHDAIDAGQEREQAYEELAIEPVEFKRNIRTNNVFRVFKCKCFFSFFYSFSHQIHNIVYSKLLYTEYNVPKSPVSPYVSTGHFNAGFFLQYLIHM